MHNTISAEFMKIQKNKIFLVCSIIVIASAAVIVIKDLFFIEPPDDYQSWIMNSYVVTTLILGIMSGFVLTFLIQREYEDKTIINVLTAPTSRFRFLMSKLVIWFLWYAGVLLAIEVIYLIGGFLIYQGQFGFEGAKILVISLTKSHMLRFIATIPLLWIAILQKKIFYPSIMAALVFTGIEMTASNMPVQAGIVIPWSAVPLVGIYDVPFPYNTIGIVSIILTSIIGFALSYTSFRMQDQ